MQGGSDPSDPRVKADGCAADGSHVADAHQQQAAVGHMQSRRRAASALGGSRLLASRAIATARHTLLISRETAK